MSSVKALFQGLGRVLASPALVLFLWLVSLLAATPLAISMASSIEESVGASLVHQKLRDGFDMGWYGEFAARAKGIEKTLSPSIVGAGAFFDNIEAWLNGRLFEMLPGLVALGVAYALLWALLLGGIFHRYAEGTGGRFRLAELLSHGAEFFFRFVRLAVISGFLYYLVYRFASWLFSWIEDRTRDATVERAVLAQVILGSLLVVLLLTLVNMAFDYAKIAAYKENRRSMILAAIRGFRLVLGNLGRTTLLYYGLGALGLVLLGAYHSMAPGPGQASASSIVLGFLVGQAYLVAKLVLRLTFYAGQMALYESPKFNR
jgi:hypothetical protein